MARSVGAFLVPTRNNGDGIMAKKKSLVTLVQDAIKKGANTAEDVHRAIADRPLKVLEKIDALSGPAKKIKRVQDESIGSIYDLIREINEQVGNYAKDMLAEASKAGIGAEKPKTKPKPKPKATKAKPKAVKAAPKAAPKRKP
jgi:hypothetical protein